MSFHRFHPGLVTERGAQKRFVKKDVDKHHLPEKAPKLSPPIVVQTKTSRSVAPLSVCVVSLEKSEMWLWLCRFETPYSMTLVWYALISDYVESLVWVGKDQTWDQTHSKRTNRFKVYATLKDQNAKLKGDLNDSKCRFGIRAFPTVRSKHRLN